MKNVIHGTIVGVLAVALLLAVIGGVRWAKRGGTAAGLVANALLLSLGMGIVAKPPQTGVAQAEESRENTGGESGDPPVG
jgi:hypothetical protein